NHLRGSLERGMVCASGIGKHDSDRLAVAGRGGDFFEDGSCAINHIIDHNGIEAALGIVGKYRGSIRSMLAVDSQVLEHPSDDADRVGVGADEDAAEHNRCYPKQKPASVQVTEVWELTRKPRKIVPPVYRPGVSEFHGMGLSFKILRVEFEFCAPES